MQARARHLSVAMVALLGFSGCVSLPVPDPEFRTLNERTGFYEGDIRFYSNDRKTIPKLTEAAKEFCRSKNRLYEYQELAFDPNRCNFACGVTTLVFYCR